MFFLALFTLNALGAGSFAPDCQAIFRDTDEKTLSSTELSAPLSARNGPNGKVLEARLAGRLFRVELGPEGYFSHILAGPEFTQGVSSRGAGDQLGRLELTAVDGLKAYRLQCRVF